MATKKTRILIVDDEESFTRLLQFKLERGGCFEVRTVNCAREAFTAAREFRPDLVLMDIIMPDMDGGELAATFESDAEFKHVPILFLTAIVSRQETEGGGTRMIGSHRFIAKPVTSEELLQAVHESLRTNGPAQEDGHGDGSPD